MELNSKEIFRQNGVYVTESEIPQTYTEKKTIFFVSGCNGDEYGQFQNKRLALEKGRKMAALTEEERKGFDE